MFMGHFNNAKRVTLKCKKKEESIQFPHPIACVDFPQFHSLKSKIKYILINVRIHFGTPCSQKWA